MKKCIFLFVLLLLIAMSLNFPVISQGKPDIDTDGDGLKDYEERNIYGTSPVSFDSDDDGVGDGYEVMIGSDPLDSDTDSDRLSDGEELALGTSPLLKDTDGDGLSDYFEVVTLPEVYKLPPSNPTNPDTDGDGLSDGFEWEHHGSNMKRYLNPDEDGDGIKDGDEHYFVSSGYGGVHHYSCDFTPDCDGDFIPDNEELRLGTLPYNPDTDGDGLPDNLELKFGSSPFDVDTDGDGISDFNEVLPELIYEFKKTENLSAFLGRSVPNRLEYEWWGAFVSNFLNTTDTCVPSMRELRYYLELNLKLLSVPQRYIRTGMHSYLNPLFTADYAERYEKGEIHSDNAVCYFGIPTDPTKYDSDGDGLSDYEEMHYTVITRTKPGGKIRWIMRVHESDGRLDMTEMDQLRPLILDPNDPDSDGDGIIDSEDPVPVKDDIDGDLLNEQDVCAYYIDCDGDEISDYYEHILGTDPKNPDTDGDGLTDYEEMGQFGVISLWQDYPYNIPLDNLTVPTKTKYWRYSDPLNPDTDGDGFTDFQEKEAGTDPTNPKSHPKELSTVQKPKYEKTPELKKAPKYEERYKVEFMINGKKIKPGTSTMILDTDSITLEIKAHPMKIIKDNETEEIVARKIGLYSRLTEYTEVSEDTFTKTLTLENFTDVGLAFVEFRVSVYYGEHRRDLEYDVMFKYKTLPQVELVNATWSNYLDVGRLTLECRFCKNITIIVPGALVNGRKKRIIEFGETKPLKYVYARIIPHRYIVASQSDVGTIYTKYEDTVEVLKTGKDIGLLAAKAVEAKSLGSKIIYGMVATAKGIKTIVGGVEVFIPEEEVEKPEGIDTPESAKFDKEAFKEGILDWVKEKIVDATFDYVTEKAVEYADAKELEARRHETTYRVTVKACNEFGCKAFAFSVNGYAYDFE
ncbi:calcium-binding protein [Pyrococcus sp. ST04]|uniref:calcium-binding protein n=1 Tax=Pyrococcus sp. ST04 TaxID=1183377 RepID=UPI0002605A6C|nr:calcium-binding protein [Pyrococcus sp. ST04]AFK22045.1 Calcium-binding protein [Pyrococcus sp. ST04]